MRKLLSLIILFPLLSLAQVGVNTTTPKAALDVESSNNGILIPRVQLTSALDITTVVNPNLGPLETSTMVYNLAPAGMAPNDVLSGFYFWNGARWIPISGTATSGWSLTGNAVTNPTTLFGSNFTATENFIGTTDYQDLLFGTNNRPLMKMTAFGNIGIGVDNPNAKLQIDDNSPYITTWIQKSNLSGSFGGGGYVSPTLLVATGSINGGTNETYHNAQFFASGTNGATNVAGYFNATGAANNYAIIVPAGAGNVGIGTSVPTATLNVETIDQPFSIKNKMEYNNGLTDAFAIDNDISGMNSRTKYGLRNYFKSSPGSKVGVYNLNDPAIFGYKTGMLNSFVGTLGDVLNGVENRFVSSDFGSSNGILNTLSTPAGAGGSSIVSGVRSVITSNSTGPAYGVINTISSTSNVTGGISGVLNQISGSKTSGKIGIKNEITSTVPDTMIGISNTITSSVDGGSIEGITNVMSTNTNTPTYGNVNQLGGTGNGIIRGVYSFITNSGTGNHVGILSNLSGSGSGTKTGTFTIIDPTAGGTHYGIYSEVLKTGNNFAARFLGKVTIGTAASIGIDNYVFPMTRGTNGQIMQTDGTGNLSWQNPGTVISNTSWSLNGNIVNAATHFLGSTNNADVVFKRSNTKAGVIGEFNTAFGLGALDATTGVYNVAIGVNALTNLGLADQNVAVGWNALSNVSSGGNNIGIGTGAQVPTAAGNNQIRMGNVNIAYAGIQVAWSVTSDRRWKDNIQNTDLGLDFISKLRPVSYFRKNDVSKKTEYGFIAQELDQTLKDFGAVNNGTITKDEEGLLSVRYNDLLAPMVKAIQELKSQNDHLQEKNDTLLKRLQAIEEKLSK